MANRIVDERPASRTGKQDLHVWVQPEVRRRIRIHAVAADRTLSEVVEQALLEYLERHATE